MLTDREKVAARKGRLLKDDNDLPLWVKGEER